LELAAKSKKVSVMFPGAYLSATSGRRVPACVESIHVKDVIDRKKEVGVSQSFTMTDSNGEKQSKRGRKGRTATKKERTSAKDLTIDSFIL